MNYHTSSIPFSENAYKSILFRSSAIILQFAIYKIFSFLAFHHRSFTSYVMFDESSVQKAQYIISRKFNRHSFLVIGFAVIFGVSGLWDTMLWGLDAPGWVLRPTRATAGAIRSRKDPSYVVHTICHRGDVGGLELVRDLGEGLWDEVNATFTGIVELGVPRIASVATYRDRHRPGARIWLDDSGFSVSVDYWQGTTSSFGCPEQQQENIVSWNCQYDQFDGDSKAFDFIMNQFAVPVVWWEEGGALEFDRLLTNRAENPWTSMGAGGGTAFMKEVFTVTKGTTRHTFLLSAFKVTLLSFQDKPIDILEAKDLVERTWPENRDISESSDVMDAISSAIQLYHGLTMGRQTTNGYTVTSRIYQLMSPVAGNTTAYTAFQILDANVTIIRTETLPATPEPFESCDTWYRNEAIGGKVRATDCKTRRKVPGRESRFLGQTDISTVFVVQEVLGKPIAETAAAALNETAWRWLQTHNSGINNLVFSRGYFLGINPATVLVDIKYYKPAASILQIILAAIPFVAALLAYRLVQTRATWHYQASLFSNLVATTHPGYDSNKPTYMKNPPELQLEARDDRVCLGTQNGVFWQTSEFRQTPSVITWDDAGKRSPQTPAVNSAGQNKSS